MPYTMFITMNPQKNVRCVYTGYMITYTTLKKYWNNILCDLDHLFHIKRNIFKRGSENKVVCDNVVCVCLCVLV